MVQIKGSMLTERYLCLTVNHDLTPTWEQLTMPINTVKSIPPRLKLTFLAFVSLPFPPQLHTHHTHCQQWTRGGHHQQGHKDGQSEDYSVWGQERTLKCTWKYKVVSHCPSSRHFHLSFLISVYSINMPPIMCVYVYVLCMYIIVSCTMLQ